MMDRTLLALPYRPLFPDNLLMLYAVCRLLLRLLCLLACVSLQTLQSQHDELLFLDHLLLLHFVSPAAAPAVPACVFNLCRRCSRSMMSWRRPSGRSALPWRRSTPSCTVSNHSSTDGRIALA
jgi:hypothetical protein